MNTRFKKTRNKLSIFGNMGWLCGYIYGFTASIFNENIAKFTFFCGCDNFEDGFDRGFKDESR